jgi:DNA-binding response OmpR family regulator
MRILLAEDERSLSKALTAILQRNHYSVDQAYDGQQALDYLEAEEPYDAVILDIMMPRLDGLSVLKQIRAEGSLVPVILLTAKSDVEDKIAGLDDGANDYLTKPFDANELMARLRAITRSHPAQGDSRLAMGNITLDQATYELSSPFGSFKLANKEYQMMELLLRNPHKIISPERFMERIWGYDSDTEINVVWVYVSYLRKKLTALKATIQIKATRNAGYSLEDKTDDQ